MLKRSYSSYSIDKNWFLELSQMDARYFISERWCLDEAAEICTPLSRRQVSTFVYNIGNNSVHEVSKSNFFQSSMTNRSIMILI